MAEVAAGEAGVWFAGCTLRCADIGERQTAVCDDGNWYDYSGAVRCCRCKCFRFVIVVVMDMV